MNYCYKFPVVKGIQAKKTYYIAMVPLKMLARLFPMDEEYVLPEYRAQRRLNESRIPDIKNYILNNEESYVFSALAASIDGRYSFIESNYGDVGMLEVDMDATFLINDGQHRKAAIIEALKENPELGEETIPVVFFEDRGLSRSQQMFTDLNKHAVKTSNSIAELYDSRDSVAVVTRNIISRIDFLDEYVDKEKDNLGKYSSSLFALNTFYKANKRIIGKKECDEKLQEFLYIFWKLVTKHMVPWNDVQTRNILKKDIREQYIATQAVIIQAFGRVGQSLIDKKENEIEEVLCKLESINWRRNCPEWRGRVIRHDGKMMTGTKAELLASNAIKKSLGITLTDEEQYAESVFEGNRI